MSSDILSLFGVRSRDARRLVGPSIIPQCSGSLALVPSVEIFVAAFASSA